MDTRNPGNKDWCGTGKKPSDIFKLPNLPPHTNPVSPRRPIPDCQPPRISPCFPAPKDEKPYKFFK